MIARLHIPGSWMWSEWQPERGMNFNSYLFERGDAMVAVDPLAIDSDSGQWIRSRGGLKTIVLTNRDHVSATQMLRGEFGARVVVPEAEAPLFEIPVAAMFRDGDEVFQGAFAVGLPHGKTMGEAALHLIEERCAVVGDAIIGSPAGALGMLPREKLANPEAFFASLRKLWQLQLQSLLLGDGQPVFRGADDALGMLIESEGGPAMNRINADEIEFERDSGNPRFESYDGEVGLPIGARKLRYRLTKVPPGKAFCPMHSHVFEEGFFFVLEGNPSIRTPRGTIECRPGDFVAFPAGERAAHQLRNDGAQDCLVLLVGLECGGRSVLLSRQREGTR